MPVELLQHPDWNKLFLSRFSCMKTLSVPILSVVGIDVHLIYFLKPTKNKRLCQSVEFLTLGKVAKAVIEFYFYFFDTNVKGPHKLGHPPTQQRLAYSSHIQYRENLDSIILESRSGNLYFGSANIPEFTVRV